MNLEINYLNQIILTEKEFDCLSFLIKNYIYTIDEDEKIFQLRDLSLIGFQTTQTTLKNLYDKGLLNKPKNAYYSLNINFLTELYKNYEVEKQKEEEKRLEEINKKLKNRRVLAWFFIPFMLFFLLIDIALFSTKFFFLGGFFAVPVIYMFFFIIKYIKYKR